MGILWWILIGGVLVLAWRKLKQAMDNTSTDIEKKAGKEINRQIMQIISERLLVPIEDVKALQNGAQNDELLEQIETHLLKTEVEFERVNRLYFCRVSIHWLADLEARKVERIKIKSQWSRDELPDVVREKFVQSGESVLVMDWNISFGKE